MCTLASRTAPPRPLAIHKPASLLLSASPPNEHPLRLSTPPSTETMCPAAEDGGRSKQRLESTSVAGPVPAVCTVSCPSAPRTNRDGLAADCPQIVSDSPPRPMVSCRAHESRMHRVVWSGRILPSPYTTSPHGSRSSPHRGSALPPLFTSTVGSCGGNKKYSTERLMCGSASASTTHLSASSSPSLTDPAHRSFTSASRGLSVTTNTSLPICALFPLNAVFFTKYSTSTSSSFIQTPPPAHELSSTQHPLSSASSIVRLWPPPTHPSIPPPPPLSLATPESAEWITLRVHSLVKASAALECVQKWARVVVLMSVLPPHRVKSGLRSGVSAEWSGSGDMLQLWSWSVPVEVRANSEVAGEDFAVLWRMPKEVSFREPVETENSEPSDIDETTTTSSPLPDFASSMWAVPHTQFVSTYVEESTETREGAALVLSTTLTAYASVLHFRWFRPHAWWSIPSAPLTLIPSKNPVQIHSLLTSSSPIITSLPPLLIDRHSTTIPALTFPTQFFRNEISFAPSRAVFSSK
ncbi:uncharacterized protein MONOS_16453 [Monocercomonoides exilis]|uniref:uncharacterized protein n=1 Tax=Monocercomonoides exilis TaxID=2049356 RepID=UPI003559B4E7|nr:hypothetical protein MONOS_16453 [Monocercomonoides exilis]